MKAKIEKLMVFLIPTDQVVGDFSQSMIKSDKLLGIVRPTQNDKLVFLGDYIDRGPNSKGVVCHLMELAEQIPCVFLRGNHEQMMLDALFCDAPDRLPGWTQLADISKLYADVATLSRTHKMRQNT